MFFAVNVDTDVFKVLTYRGGQYKDSNISFNVTIMEDDRDNRRKHFEIVAEASKNIFIPQPLIKVAILNTIFRECYVRVFIIIIIFLKDYLYIQ